MQHVFSGILIYRKYVLKNTFFHNIWFVLSKHDMVFIYTCIIISIQMHFTQLIHDLSPGL
jgi:hypothetical protein